jgi:hypothetical protein
MPLAKQLETHSQSFSDIIADRICGGHDQNCVVLFEGKMGAGKSAASLRLAFDTSLILAKRLGGRPEDYFTLDNVAILTGEETLRITRNLKKHSIYILDDIGAEGMSARGWQSDQNQVMTKLMQTFRTMGNLLIMSSPDKDFVDVIARKLIHYKVTMVATYYSINTSLGKLSTVRKIYTKDSSPNLYPFLRGKNCVYNYIRFSLPPKPIMDKYKKMRDEGERKMNLAAQEEMIYKRQIAAMKEEEKRIKMEEKIEEYKARGGTIASFNGGVIDVKQAVKDKKDMKDMESKQRKENARLYKSYVRSGMDATEALEQASTKTGIKLSQPSVLRDCKKYGIE